MTNISTTFTEPISGVDDLSKHQITEKVFVDEPPPNELVCPESMNDPSTSSTVRQIPSGPTYNMISTSAFIDRPPVIIQSTDQIESYRCWSILNIFCCCLCLGCLACYYSSEIKDLQKMGDIQGALNASRKARKINAIATTIGSIFIVINTLHFIVKS
jgi:hypothetical protein